MMVFFAVAGFIGIALLIHNDAAPVLKPEPTVTCSSTRMRIDIPRTLVPKYNAEDLTFLDTSCSGVGNETHITLETGYRGCGTLMSVDWYTVLFDNKVRSRPLSADAFITRKRPVDLAFGCSLTRDKKNYPIGLIPSAPHLASHLIEYPLGELKIDLKVTDTKGNKLGSNNIVNIQVGEIVEVHITGNKFVEKGLRVSAENCYVTHVPDSKSTPSYYLIRNRCPVDETVKFIPTNGFGERFSFEVFRFLKYPTAPLHIHCETVICDSSDSSSTCAKGCEDFN